MSDDSPFVFRFSTLEDGQMPNASEDDPVRRDHLKHFLHKAGFDLERSNQLSLAHESGIFVLRRDGSYGKVAKTDGVIVPDARQVWGRVVVMSLADCFPVFLEDKVRRIAGLVHAGWRGTLAKIVPSLVELMVSYGSTPHDITAIIGPGIRSCHLEIRRDGCLEAFIKKGYGGEEFVHSEGELYFADLPAIFMNQLRSEGVTDAIDTEECTFCLEQKYPSFRRDGNGNRFAAYIGAKT